MALADALQGIKEAQTTKGDKPVKASKAARPAPEPEALREVTFQRPTGKSSRPDYEKVGLYVRTDLRRNAFRKFEDSGGRDFSDLIETLLSKYVGA